MDELRMRITEKPLDIWAKRVVALEYRTEALLDLLDTDKTLERLEMDKPRFDAVRKTPVAGIGAAARYFEERETALKEARRDELVERLKLVTRELESTLPPSPGRTRSKAEFRSRGRKTVQAS